jgi:hypothetical protein
VSHLEALLTAETVAAHLHNDPIGVERLRVLRDFVAELQEWVEAELSEAEKAA